MGQVIGWGGGGATPRGGCGCVAQARHTGIKIVQQIAILLGCAVLPHLKALVDIVKHGLTDENQKVMATRLSLPVRAVGADAAAAAARLFRATVWFQLLGILQHCCLA